MNRAFTFGIKGDRHVVLTEPSVPFSQQRRDFKKVCAEKLGDDETKFDAIEIWTSSGGRVKRRKLKGSSLGEPAVVAEEETDDGPDEPVTPQHEAPKPAEPVVAKPATPATVATAKSVPWGKKAGKAAK